MNIVENENIRGTNMFYVTVRSIVSQVRQNSNSHVPCNCVVRKRKSTQT